MCVDGAMSVVDRPQPVKLSYAYLPGLFVDIRKIAFAQVFLVSDICICSFSLCVCVCVDIVIDQIFISNSACTPSARQVHIQHTNTHTSDIENNEGCAVTAYARSTTNKSPFCSCNY